MFRRMVPLALVATLSLVAPCLAQNKNSSILGRNLLKNGNIEAVTSDNKKVPGWGTSPALSEAVYGSEAGEWDWGLSGCATCQKHYLRLAFGTTTHEASVSQTVNVTPAARQIDAGKVTAHLAAWLGGYLKSDTTGTIEASFQDGSGKVLGTLSTDPFDSSTLPQAPRGSTGLTRCEKTGAVPDGTRKIVYTFDAKSTGGSGDYLGLGDNFSLVLTSP